MILIATISSFFATLAYSIVFNVPKNHLLICSAIGSIGWTAYTLCSSYFLYSEATSNFVAALIVSTLATILSRQRFAPVTVFLIPGIIPLVPGYALYKTMYALVIADYSQALNSVLTAFLISGCIAGAITIVTFIPPIFGINKRGRRI
ncbi:MAG: hypothetical protein ATN36_02330 [Epulopiscium sp. Nele67-Bin005]|nr:MAG: hypothetical protein ATN36_02330 [Epulopiscium sp. Nele67-Bin005]